MRSGTPTFARALAFVLALALLPCMSAGKQSLQQKKKAARTQFETAERLREALNGKPEDRRTRRDYQNVMEAYRKVYYTAPSSVKADAAVLAVAELLDEQGRVLNDDKSFKDSIGQYQFLRREYPGSKYRVDALFTIAQIYHEDLNDNEQAKAAYQDFLKHYPNAASASDARKALAEIGDQEVGGNPFKRKPGKTAKAAPPAKKTPAPARNAEKTESAASTAPDTRTKPAGNDAQQEAQDAAAKDASPKQDASAAAPKEDAADAHAVPAADTRTAGDAHRMPRLTGIRHWSTPDYTRVAIDLEQEVQYEAGRVPHPDRIFFDLHGTRLASDLVGKSFDVDDSGFLRKIRVAQYRANLVRVVLDVDDVAEYSAFLLPNPYRLIIDIHGKLPPHETASAERKQTPADATPSDDKQPATVTDVTHGAPAAEAKSKPGSTSAKRGKTTEVAKADAPKIIDDGGADTTSDKNPDTAAPRVIDDTRIDAGDSAEKATSKPTSGPTFESVAPRESSRRKKTATADANTPASTTHAASPTANGDRSLIRALGLKIGKIVVDAGHGGHDTGTIGPNGLMEKDLVLDVALKLGKMLESKMGAEVVYTRDDDTFIPLETRTAIANKEEADLFISIHANSSSDPTARGIETYYLNFTTSAGALEVAARENAVSDKSIHELQDLVKKIALKEKIEESREFAGDVQHSLYTGLNARNPGLRNRGVKKAPFIVLIGANMPSILAEISFVSNPGDEKKLKTNDYRQRIADSLYKGIAKYVSGLSGVKVAAKVQQSGDGATASTLASK